MATKHRVIIGRDFRAALKRPMPGTCMTSRPPRVVPPFSYQTHQRNTVVQPPPRANNRRERTPAKSNFESMYKRGGLPVNPVGKGLVWKDRIETLDYHHYLPIFFDGLRAKDERVRRFAQMGVRDMLAAGGNKVLPVLPQLVMPIKHALDTRNKDIMAGAMKVLQELAMAEQDIGEALVPYYRTILPVFNIFKDDNVNNWDVVDVSHPIGDTIEQTLHILERLGGEDAFINIKYMVPTYESCVLN